MAIVEVPTKDLMELRLHTQVMIHPGNALGIKSGGIADAFEKEYPNSFDMYKTGGFVEGTFRVGTVLETIEKNHVILHLITKNHYGDVMSYDDLRVCLNNLKDYLLDNSFIDRSKYVCCIPILGCYNNQLDTDTVVKMYYDILDDIPNIIQLCRQPESYNRFPQYLGLCGHIRFNNKKLLKVELSTFINNVFPTALKAIVITDTNNDFNRTVEDVVDELNIKLIKVPTDFKQFKKNGFYIRNSIMFNICTAFLSINKNKFYSSLSYFLEEKVVKYNRNCDDLRVIKKYNEPDLFVPDRKVIINSNIYY